MLTTIQYAKVLLKMNLLKEKFLFQPIAWGDANHRRIIAYNILQKFVKKQTVKDGLQSNIPSMVKS